MWVTCKRSASALYRDERGLRSRNLQMSYGRGGRSRPVPFPGNMCPWITRVHCTPLIRLSKFLHIVHYSAILVRTLFLCVTIQLYRRQIISIEGLRLLKTLICDHPSPPLIGPIPSCILYTRSIIQCENYRCFA